MTIALSILVIVVAYLMGSIPFPYLISRLFGQGDIRSVGNRNMGAANVFRKVSPRAGVIVFFADVAKAAAATGLARGLHLPLGVVLAVGTAAILGHMWPVFLQCRGGMGAACTIGVMLVLMPREVLLAAVVAVPFLVVTHNVGNTVFLLLLLLAPLGLWLGEPVTLLWGYAIPSLLIWGRVFQLRWAQSRAASTEPMAVLRERGQNGG